jgi:phage terminase small subunit
MGSKPLSPKQRKFVVEYLIDRNASQASIRAGYSKKNANVVGSRLLANVGIKAEIEAKTAKMDAATEITAANVLNRLWGIGSAANSTMPSHSDRVRALELVGKHFKMFTDRFEVTDAAMGLADRVRQARERLKKRAKS